jgi:hypothetical protein
MGGRVNPEVLNETRPWRARIGDIPDVVDIWQGHTKVGTFMLRGRRPKAESQKLIRMLAATFDSFEVCKSVISNPTDDVVRRAAKVVERVEGHL